MYTYIGCTSNRAGHVRATYAGTAINRHSVKGNQEGNTMTMHDSDFRTTKIGNKALRQIGREENLAAREKDIGIVDCEQVCTAAHDIALQQPVFLELLASLVESWQIAAERMVGMQEGTGAVVMDITQIVDLRAKMRKFVCPTLANGTRLTVTDEPYTVPFLHTLQDYEIDDITQGTFSLFDMARSKQYGARVTNRSIREMMFQTPVSLQHLDPNKFRKIVQGYEDCAPVENKSMLPNTGTLGALVASGSPDWSLESMTPEEVIKCGWETHEVWTLQGSTMISPIALAFTWLHDKTESLGNIFYYDAPMNNGGKPSESINRSGCGIKALKDACDIANLATWLHNGGGNSQNATKNQATWVQNGEITIITMKRMIAGLSLLIKHHGETTRAAATTFYPQTKWDTQGVDSQVGKCPPANSVDRRRPQWPPGVTGTMESLNDRLEYGTFSHCSNILGEDASQLLRDRYTLPQKVITDPVRYTHPSDAHLPHPGETPVLINPGELMRLLPPVDNPSLFAPRHGNRPNNPISARGDSWSVIKYKKNGKGRHWRDQR